MVLCGAAPLHAGELRVALVVAVRTEMGTDEAPTADGRIRAELIAGGLDVITLVERRKSSRTTLKSAAARTQSIAAISTSMDGGVAIASVWLTAGKDREARLVYVEVLGEGDERDRLLDEVSPLREQLASLESEGRIPGPRLSARLGEVEQALEEAVRELRGH